MRQLIIATALMSVIGITLFLVIVLTYNKLLQKNESGFLHLLMSFMYACWLPIPFAVLSLFNNYKFLVVGTVFGVLSLVIMVMTMILQASHLTYSELHRKEDERLWDTNNKWMLEGLLGGQVELLANVFKGIWICFVTVCFWFSGQAVLFSLGVVFCLFTSAYLVRLIDSALVRKIKFFQLVKLNFIVINLETFAWFLILTIWIVKTL